MPEEQEPLDPPAGDTVKLVGLCDEMDQVKPVEGMARRGYGRMDRWAEPDLREAVVRWGRARWPEARVCHELVMDRGSVRLDVGFVSPEHLAVVELKSGYDTVERLCHQACIARLAADEVWLVTDPVHRRDADLIRYLLPTLGLAEPSVSAWRHRASGAEDKPCELVVRSEPEGSLAPVAELQLAMLWVAELHQVARWSGRAAAPRMSHANLVKHLAPLPAAERRRLVCRALRGRDALWRADPPIREAE